MDQRNNNKCGKIKVVVTAAEASKAPAPWPGANADQRMVALMRSKGLRFRVMVDPKPTDLLPPWYAYRCAYSDDLTIEQGGGGAPPTPMNS